MDAVREKSRLLPENAAPPVIIRFLPRGDDDLEKVLVHKAARPAEGRDSLEVVARSMSETIPNAVVQECFSHDGAVINAPQRATSQRSHCITGVSSWIRQHGREHCDAGVVQSCCGHWERDERSSQAMVLWQCLCVRLQVLQWHA